jgi:hypothetical protein
MIAIESVAVEEREYLAAGITPALARNLVYTRVFSKNIQTFTTL